MEKGRYTCIICPVSCTIDVEKTEDGWKTQGNKCKRGQKYAISEHTEPARMITTTVAVEKAMFSRLPVISEREVPKTKLRECLNYLYGIRIEAPVRCGDVIVSDICGTGVNILAAKTIRQTL